MKYLALCLVLYSTNALALSVNIGVSANLVQMEKKNAYGALMDCRVLERECIELELRVAQCVYENTLPEDCTI